MSHTSPSSSTHHSCDIYRQTNVPDYEKALHDPNITFSRGSPPGDGGLYRNIAMTNKTTPSLSSQLRNDQRYSVTPGTRASGHELNYNIPSHGSSYTSPQSHLLSPTSVRRSPGSPTDNESIQHNVSLPPDRVYSPPRYRAGGYGEERRNTLYMYDEEPIFTPLQPEDPPGLHRDDHLHSSATPSAHSSPSYGLTNLHGMMSLGPRTTTDPLPSPIDTGHKHSSLNQPSQLRKSHQELTSEAMRHHHSITTSLGAAARQRSMLDIYQHRMSNRTTSLDGSRTHSRSANELFFLGGPPSNMSDDLCNWQQSHKQRLLHQKAEAQAISTGNIKCPSVGNLYDPISAAKDNDAPWGVIKSAANEIIHGKDSLIDDLQEKHLVQQADLVRQSSENEMYRCKIQELEYQNSSLKSKLSQISSTKNNKIDDLEIQLGAAEGELRNWKSKWTDKEMVSRIQLDDVESKMAEKNEKLKEWQKRFTDMRGEHLKVREKLNRLEVYLSSHPSEDEVQDMKLELKTLRADTSTQKVAISDLQGRLLHAKKHARSQEAEMMRLREESKKVVTELRGASSELERIKSVGEGAELARVAEEATRLRENKERLAKDLEKANKMLERSRRVIQQAEIKHQGQVQQLEERLNQEEEAVTAQREEVNNKEERIQKLRDSIKELSQQNQELMMESLSVKEKLSVYERHGSEESHMLERQLTREMRLCFVELQSLVQICSDRAEGHEPNMSELLGDTSTLDIDSDEDFSYSSTGSSQASSQGGPTKEPDTLALKHRLTKVTNLRKEIRKLRGVVSNKLAEDLGKRITCATQ